MSATVLSDDWYRLLRSVHYLGYHTAETMSYFYDSTKKYSLVTSNPAEVKEVGELTKAYQQNPKSLSAAIWIIEGREESSGVVYRLREVFHPQQIQKAKREHYEGAKREFDYMIDGSGTSLGKEIILNQKKWFKEFLKNNGNFGYGLRFLRDQDVKEEFLALAKPFFVETSVFD